MATIAQIAKDVAKRGDRVTVEIGGEEVALVSLEDLEALEDLEDAALARASMESLSDPESIPWEECRRRILGR